jgi:hypothetical protein
MTDKVDEDMIREIWERAEPGSVNAPQGVERRHEGQGVEGGS